MTDLNLQIGDTVQCKNGQLTTVADIRQGAKTTVSLASFTGFHDLNGLYNGSAHHSYDISRNLSEEQRRANAKTFNAFEVDDVVYLRSGRKTRVTGVSAKGVQLPGFNGPHELNGMLYNTGNVSQGDIVHNETAGERLKAMLPEIEPPAPAMEFKDDDKVQLRNGHMSRVWRVDTAGVKLCDFHQIHRCDGTYPHEINSHFDIVRNLSLEERQAATAPAAAINHLTREDVDAFREDIRGSLNSLDRYQDIATKSAIYPGKGTPFGLMYVALGLAEAGEVQNKVKKAFRDDGLIDFDMHPETETAACVTFKPITEERRKQLIKELGGALWYISATCNELGIKLSDVAYSNLDELCGRTERDTLRGDGDDR